MKHWMVLKVNWIHFNRCTILPVDQSQYLLNFWFLLVFAQLVVQWHFMAQKLIILAEIKISDKFSWEFNLLKQGIMSNEWRVNYGELIHWNRCSRGLNELNLIGFCVKSGAMWPSREMSFFFYLINRILANEWNQFIFTATWNVNEGCLFH